MKLSDGQALAILAVAVLVIGAAAYLILNPVKPAPPGTVGNVTLNVIEDQSCLQCPPTSPVVNSIKTNGVPVGEWKTYNYNSTEGRSLIQKYGVVRVPVIIVSENIRNYMDMGNLSSTKGAYLVYPLLPPYRNLSDDKIDGVVDVYFITDSTCKDCYNVTIHADILQQSFKIAIGSALNFDINYPLGREFVDRYNITAVPTYILSADAKYYPRLTKAWESVGTIESNGYYVFRNVTQVGLTYKNLTSGKTVQQNATV